MTLIAEDLLLLLLDDDTGRIPALQVDAQIPLAAAALAELGLAGALAVEPGSFLTGARLRATGTPATDPTLARVLAVVAERPRTATAVIARVKRGLQDDLSERLAAAGVLRRAEDRAFGIFPRTSWPAADLAREREVRVRLAEVLLRGAEPDARTAVLAGVLSGLDRVPRTLGLHGGQAREAARRARAVAKGEWAAKVVTDAVRAAMVAATSPVIGATAVAPGSR